MKAVNHSKIFFYLLRNREPTFHFGNVFTIKKLRLNNSFKYSTFPKT